MNLSHAYAQVLRENGAPEFVKKLVAFMKSRGHMSLLPEITRILTRDPKRKGAVVMLADDKDGKKYSAKIRAALKDINEDDAETVVDPKMVGGYTVLGRSKVIDKSFRSALVSIYQKTIRNQP